VRRAKDRMKNTETGHHFISKYFRRTHELFICQVTLNKASLSSLAWERNFSVVKSGFFSSKIRLQKFENLASAETNK